MNKRISEIRTADPFESLFPVDGKVLDAICRDMEENGYDQTQPIIMWNGVVIDGHTRRMAAESLGFEEIPVLERHFDDEDAAVEYAIHLQRDRRNLTDADICRFVMEIDRRKKQGERSDLTSTDAKSGRSSQHTAEVVGTSSSKVEKIRTVVEHAAPEVKADMLAGTKTVNAAYVETQKARKTDEQEEAELDETPVKSDGFNLDRHIMKMQPVIRKWLDEAPGKCHRQMREQLRTWAKKI